MRCEVGQVFFSPCGVLASNFVSLLLCSPNAVLLFWWSGDFQAPSDAREQGLSFSAATAELGQHRAPRVAGL